MAFKILWVTVFIMFFQPTYVFPILLSYSPLKYTALIALVFYYFSNYENRSQISFFSVKTNYYFSFFIFFQILSASSNWIAFGIDILNFWLRYFIVYYLIIKSSVNSFRIVRLASSIVFAISYLAYFSITNFVLIYKPGMRAAGFGWYENSNDLSVILVSVVPLAYLLFEIAIGKFKKFIFFSITVIFSLNILFTGSRNGLLGLFTVGILSIILSNVPKFIRLCLTTLLCISIIGIGLATVLSRDDLSGLSGDDSSEHRIVQWNACWEMIKSHPILGVGPGESSGEMRFYGGIGGLAPHNTIIQAFAETGIPGGICFILFGLSPLFVFYKNLGKYISVKKIEYVIYKYLCVSLTGFWICAFFSNRVEGYQLYILVALIVGISNLIVQNETQNNNVMV